MGSMKMMAVAVVLTAGWMGVGAVCFASLAKAPQAVNTVLSHGRGAPVERVPTAPTMSVAQLEASPEPVRAR